MRQITLILILWLFTTLGFTQTATLSGTVNAKGEGSPLSFANLILVDTDLGTTADEEGIFSLEEIPAGDYALLVSYLGYETKRIPVSFTEGEQKQLDISLITAFKNVDEVVITGTMKEVNRLESPVPVEVYNPVFFRKNPTPNIYEALQNVNGVRPQMNCQVCNTGDIHINGLEGPYTMVLIDGMPIVSSLATVYGLFGIPNAMIERTEIVKGPASSLYGSEAIGGLINIITKTPEKAPLVTADVMGTSWAEYNADLGFRFNLGGNASVLTGLNYFNYDQPIDNNGDNFTDITLVERASVFQKWSFKRKNNRLFTLAGRYYWEDRWGGEMNWTPAYRGGDQIYGEAITTNRWELLGQYELPTTENLLFSFSANGHDQNSVYGDMPYLGQQNIAFGQLTWDKNLGRHDLLLGTALRYTYYDDNTPATGGEASSPENDPDEIWLPGIFIQDEIRLDERHKFLLGLRYDYNNDHGNIFTPRFAYKWSITPNDIFRLNAGTGFRVVNLFTEDHAALTGAREVVITEALNPERSYNINANYIKKMYLDNGGMASLDFSAWYTHFTNAIFPDYETNSNQIIYDNLDGFAVTQGMSLNADLELPSGLSFLLGATLMDVTTEEEGVRQRQILTERFTGTWSISYRFAQNKWSVDYTGNVYGPMRLPLLGELDPRPEYSPWWSIQNVQFTYKGFEKVEIYGGVKNLLNWTPWKNQEAPIIARSFDPFDRQVEFDQRGNVLATANNPNALTFDPSYVFAPNQGIRGFLGVRYNLD
ncbi:MAG TPA: TonB-dependent receptor [Saprospiraceae bacterium]|nr:TonB-dependent receptor [Saprospiraceae bacterium]